ncbi:hypothetical protein SARC_09458, partial [Sphaeroforma arctica JP610]
TDNSQEMYVRVKREKSTMFIGCLPTDTIDFISEDVAMIMKKNMGDFVLMKTTGNDQKYTVVSGALDRDRTLEELGIKQDDVLACVYKLEGVVEDFSNLIVPVSVPPKMTPEGDSQYSQK